MVSIIVPVYNTEKYICECLDSVIAQNDMDGNKELIIVDDGSTDDSLSLIKKYADIHSWIKWKTQENKRQGAARNNGLRNADGEYILFLDSDDILKEDAIKETLCCAREYDLDLVCFKADIFGNIQEYNADTYYFNMVEDLNVVISGIDFVKKYHEKISLINIPFMLIRKEFLVRNNIWFKEETFYEDNDFYMKLMSANPRMMFLDKILYLRRYRDNSTMTSEMSAVKIENKINVFMDWLILNDSILSAIFCISAINVISANLLAYKEYIKYTSGNLKNDLIKKIKELIHNTYVQKNAWMIFRLWELIINLGKCEINNEELKKDIEVVFDELITKLGFFDNNKKIGICGIGKYGRFLIKSVEESGREVQAQVRLYDDNVHSFDEKEVYPYSAIMTDGDVSYIILSKKYESEIVETLKSRGVVANQIIIL